MSRKSKICTIFRQFSVTRAKYSNLRTFQSPYISKTCPEETSSFTLRAYSSLPGESMTRTKLLNSKTCLQNSCLQRNNNPFSSCAVNNSKLNDISPNSEISYMITSDAQTEQELAPSLLVHEDFISEEEEQELLDEVEPYLKRLRYEYDHWDDAIHGFRETERQKWTKKNTAVLKRVRDVAFPSDTQQLPHVHVLDLHKDGHIKPHIDATRFCGSTIAGLSLLSPCVMRLVHDKDEDRWADVLLHRRSLYIMKDAARYSYKHEILLDDKSVFNGHHIHKDRRISVIMRNAPEDTIHSDQDRSDSGVK